MERPTPELLRSLLNYNLETGELTWKPRGNPNADARFAGKPALTGLDKDGYLKGRVQYHYVKAHRVAWAMHYGEWPDVIDHINGDIRDNRICNLRSVTDAENKKNLGLQKRNESGAHGVRLNKPYGTWRAYIAVGGRSRHLGTFKTFDEALAVRRRAERELGYHPNHGREATTSAA